MSRGCAVVAVRSEGLPPFCVDEENCLLTDVGDTKALAGAILRVIGDEGQRRRLSAAGRATAEGRTWEALLEAQPAVIRAERRPERARGLEAIRWE
jgi:glycosyltransferase involved in cell wall biosynthesis